MRRHLWIKIVALVLFGYGAYTVWLVFEYHSVWFLLWSVPCFVGAIGLTMSRAWSQYVVYLIAFCTVAGWAAFVARSWPQIPSQAIPKAFALGLGLLVVSVWSSLLVFRHFRHSGTQA